MLARLISGVKLLVCLLLVTGIAFGAAWSSGTTYATGNVVTYKNGTWRSLQNSNLNHEPVVNSAYWDWVVNIFERDGTTQTDRPTTFGAIYPQGMIATCPQPVLAGTPFTTWQADVKNRWGDGSVKFAVISIPLTLSSAGTDQITYTNNASCHSSGSGLTKAQMVGFNSGNWTSKIVVTPKSPTASAAAVTVDFKAMLNADDPRSETFHNCKNNLWLDGPVVTAVIIQDCTTAYTYDFGWLWNGTNMASDGVNPSYTTTNVKAAFHPMAIAYFYPTTNDVMIREILETAPWGDRQQDQKIDISYQGGNPATELYGKSNFLAIAGTRYPKTVWSRADQSVTKMGSILIDHNFPAMIETGLIPNYDPDPNGNCLGNSFCFNPDFVDSASQGVTKYSVWITHDKGDIGGIGYFQSMMPAGSQAQADNAEGALIELEELWYLYNMQFGATNDGLAAKSQLMLEGEVGASNTSVSAQNVAGGAGYGPNYGNLPFHYRVNGSCSGQQSTSCYEYVPKFADKDAKASDTCNDATSCGNGSGLTLYSSQGYYYNRDNFSDLNISIGAGGSNNFAKVSGAADLTYGGWLLSDGGVNDHWQMLTIMYWMTGDYYYYEEQQFSAAYMAMRPANGNAGAAASMRSFALQNSPDSGRAIAWPLWEAAKAAVMTLNVDIDGTTALPLPEYQWNKQFLESNATYICGALGITCPVAIQPTTTHPTCSGTSTLTYNINRWDYGRCNFMNPAADSSGNHLLTSHLHNFFWGNTAIEVFYSANTSTQFVNYGTLASVMGAARELGFTNLSAAHEAMGQMLIEKTLDSAYNGFLPQLESEPALTGGNNATGDFFTSYANLLNGFTSTYKAMNCFDRNNTFPSGVGVCWNHAYGLSYRAGISFLQEFGITTSDTNCPGGTCTAANAWAFYDNDHFPYFNNTLSSALACGSPNTTAGCGTSNSFQGKYAILPRDASLISDTCSISSPTAGATVSGSSVTVNGSGTPGQGSINNLTYTLDGSTSNMPAAGTSSPYNTTFNSTLFVDGSHTLAGSCTDDGGGSGTIPSVSITISNAITGGSAIKPGVKLTSGTILK